MISVPSVIHVGKKKKVKKTFFKKKPTLDHSPHDVCIYFMYVCMCVWMYIINQKIAFLQTFLKDDFYKKERPENLHLHSPFYIFIILNNFQ